MSVLKLLCGYVLITLAHMSCESQSNTNRVKQSGTGDRCYVAMMSVQLCCESLSGTGYQDTFLLHKPSAGLTSRTPENVSRG